MVEFLKVGVGPYCSPLFVHLYNRADKGHYFTVSEQREQLMHFSN